MKWSELNLSPAHIVKAVQRHGKTTITLDLCEKYMDWVERGRPVDEEIPTLIVKAVNIIDG